LKMCQLITRRSAFGEGGSYNGDKTILNVLFKKSNFSMMKKSIRLLQGSK
jgi:hypothetical protein